MIPTVEQILHTGADAVDLSIRVPYCRHQRNGDVTPNGALATSCRIRDDDVRERPIS